MEALASLATAAGLGWASGVRLYAVVFFLGLLQYFGIYHLPEHLQVVANPWVMGASGFMFLVEFLADNERDYSQSCMLFHYLEARHAGVLKSIIDRINSGAITSNDRLIDLAK